MDLYALTRALIDIPSVTEDEHAVGEYLEAHLQKLAAGTGGAVERMEVAPKRCNVFAHWGEPIVTLSTHMDTVPPFFASREDAATIYGRGACDTKGIIAAMLTAAAELLKEGRRNFGLLFVVGEERNSAGAFAAAAQPRGAKFMVNGEPTESKLALGSKGTLRYELVAQGRMAHSAYPELGESAINKLLDALERARMLKLPHDPLFGASTLNIGTISGGRAPNVIADEARAELLFRLVDDGAGIRSAITELAAACRVETREVLCVPAVKLGSLPGFETSVVAFTTDIPAFDGSWGTPFLFGPGSIHVAHTMQEQIAKSELAAAVGTYKRLVVELGARAQ